MKIDKDFKAFCSHSEWYDIIEGVGYVPTKECPEDAKDAMERVNARSKAKKKTV